MPKVTILLLRKNFKLFLFILLSVILILAVLIDLIRTSSSYAYFGSNLYSNSQWLVANNSNLANVIKNQTYEGYILDSKVFGNTIELTFKNLNGNPQGLDTVTFPNSINTSFYTIFEANGDGVMQPILKDFSITNLNNGKVSITVSTDYQTNSSYISELNFYK